MPLPGSTGEGDFEDNDNGSESAWSDARLRRSVFYEAPEKIMFKTYPCIFDCISASETFKCIFRTLNRISRTVGDSCTDHVRKMMMGLISTILYSDWVF